MSGVFKSIIESCVERLPVLEVSHAERHQNRDYIITQTIQRNVFTEFDTKLSRHLAATRGAGFPAFTIASEVKERNNNLPPRKLAPSHRASVPHALRAIAKRAFTQCGRANLVLRHNDSYPGDQSNGVPREVTAEDIDILNGAMNVCRFLGETEFLTISGDLDIIMVTTSPELKPVVMNLQSGTLSIPCSDGGTTTPFECPIRGFADYVMQSAPAQRYLAQARHAMVTAKEDAVMEFRAMAEERILSFDRALAGRALRGPSALRGHRAGRAPQARAGLDPERTVGRRQDHRIGLDGRDRHGGRRRCSRTGGAAGAG